MSTGSEGTFRSNTVMIYAFNASGKIDHLDVYVAYLGTRPA